MGRRTGTSGAQPRTGEPPPTLPTGRQGASLIETIAVWYPRRPPLEVLEEALAAHGSLSALAKALGSSRSTVRSAVDRLRAAAGVPLLPPDSEPPDDEG